MHPFGLHPDLGPILAHARLYERLAEAAIERHRASAHPTRFGVIARAAAAIRRALTEPAEPPAAVIPPISGYPFRG